MYKRVPHNWIESILGIQERTLEKNMVLIYHFDTATDAYRSMHESNGHNIEQRSHKHISKYGIPFVMNFKNRQN